jgi:hypothetical protein
MRCLALINPHPLLLLDEGLGPNGAEGDFFTFAVELQRIAGSEVKFFAEGLGNEDASGTVEGKLCRHSGMIMWVNPLVIPILAHLFLAARLPL